MTNESIELISNWVTIIGLPIAVITLAIAAGQYIYSKKIEEANFWLDLRQAFSMHNDVHLKLRNGIWSKPDAGPNFGEYYIL